MEQEVSCSAAQLFTSIDFKWQIPISNFTMAVKWFITSVPYMLGTCPEVSMVFRSLLFWCQRLKPVPGRSPVASGWGNVRKSTDTPRIAPAGANKPNLHTAKTSGEPYPVSCVSSLDYCGRWLSCLLSSALPSSLSFFYPNSIFLSKIEQKINCTCKAFL